MQLQTQTSYKLLGGTVVWSIATLSIAFFQPVSTPPAQPVSTPPDQPGAAPSATAPQTKGKEATTQSVFAGGADSAVSRTVGHAEGTRTPNGSKTRAYYGHSDPGNGVWNMGSFSYQHGAASPEAADEKQLRRLERQMGKLNQIAKRVGIKLTLVEKLNAIDIANQAPLAALGEQGFIERLAQAWQRGLKGDEAILWARTQAYWEPRLKRWNAPGLGNTEEGIRHDQRRRLLAIARALSVYKQQHPRVQLVSYKSRQTYYQRLVEVVLQHEK